MAPAQNQANNGGTFFAFVELGVQGRRMYTIEVRDAQTKEQIAEIEGAVEWNCYADGRAQGTLTTSAGAKLIAALGGSAAYRHRSVVLEFDGQTAHVSSITGYNGRVFTLVGLDLSAYPSSGSAS